jgi:hypothetical protein
LIEDITICLDNIAIKGVNFEVGEFFPVEMGMEEKVPLKEVWGWGRYFTLHPT